MIRVIMRVEEFQPGTYTRDQQWDWGFVMFRAIRSATPKRRYRVHGVRTVDGWAYLAQPCQRLVK
jgi:hypothetical protein